MKVSRIYLITLIFAAGCSNMNNDENYPESRKDGTVEEIFGVTVEDQYRWLEDFTSPESTAWEQNQNKFTEKYLKKGPFTRNIGKDLEKVWDGESISTPYVQNDRIFYYFNEGDWQHSKLMMKDCLEECEAEVLIDPNSFSDDGTFSLGGTSISPDGKWIAYSISDGGSDWRIWKIMNIETRELLEETINWSKFSGAVWEKNNSGFYYQKYSEPTDELLADINEKPKLMFHKLGTSQDEDELIYENPEQPRWGWSISISENNAHKILSISDGTEEKNRIYIKSNDSENFIPVIDELIGEYGYITSKDDVLFFYSTENAPNGKVSALTIKNGSYVWNDVISESNFAIRSVNIVNEKIVINYLVDTISNIKFFDMNGNHLNDFNFELAGTMGGFGGGIDDKETYFNFSNYVTPTKIYKINMEDFSYDIFWEERLADHNVDDYETKLWFYESKDGTKIPLHISSLSNINVDENTPILLYGYGGFDISILPGFSKRFLSWMNQGGVVAVASLRGGSEYGAKWHEDGMLFNKQNVFDDFAYAAKFLHATGIGSPQTTAIEGRSNGGLLVGATMLQNPELFKVALPGVGVMDMLRFHKFTIGWAWTSDYGSPDEKDAFLNLYEYSPYHNIKDGVCYPTTLVFTSNRDDRVVPSHSYKFAARLQEAQSCENKILIRIEDRAGHGAGTPRSKQIEAISEIYGFALNEISKK